MKPDTEFYIVIGLLLATLLTVGILAYQDRELKHQEIMAGLERIKR